MNKSEALDILFKVCDQVPMDGPNRRVVDQAFFVLRDDDPQQENVNDTSTEE